MAAKHPPNVCFTDVLLSDLYRRQICDLPFLSTSLPSPEATCIYDALFSVMGGLLNPNMAANGL